MQKKKKILFQSDFSLAKTGFGRAAKSLLTYLYKTGKYEIVHYCCGLQTNSPELTRTPWRSIGCIPANPAEIQAINRDPHMARMASYGNHLLDETMKTEKPDFYIAAQDFWGVDFAINKSWFNKIHSVIWTTLDSLPLHVPAVELAPKIKNYWVWSSFAEKEFHRLGQKQVKTVHGPLDTSFFFKMPESERKELRNKFKLEQDAFIVGFVFRNQLRKSIPNLLEGYKLWKTRNPEIKKTYLLLHTHFGEGWDILRLVKEYGINPEEILTTYICKDCKSYEVKSFKGIKVPCKYCKSKDGQTTTQVGIGITENQLNEIYNLMDVYCHPFTSGGQEIPVQEAKLAELITLVTNYSCGEELCEEGSGSLPLEWTEYREHGTQFRKASTSPASIAKQLLKVYSMDASKRKELGKKGREWTLKNYSIETIGQIFENFFDSNEPTNHEFRDDEIQKNPEAQIPEITNNSEWVKTLYKLILLRDVDENDDGFKYWMKMLDNGTVKKDIENYFRKVAVEENYSKKKIDFESLLDKDDAGKRILFVMPQSIGDVYLSTSLFENLKLTYPEYNLYVATMPQNFEVLDGNPFVHKVIQFIPQMEVLDWLEGCGKNLGYFEIAFLAHFGTQKTINYKHNGKTRIQFNINSNDKN